MKYVALCSGEYSDFSAEAYLLLPDYFYFDMPYERGAFAEEYRDRIEYLKNGFGKHYSDDNVIRIWLELDFARWLINKYDLDQYEINVHEWHVMSDQ